MKFLKESGLLLLSFILIFVWQQTFLADYTIQILVALAVIYLILTARKKEFSLISKTGDHISILILATMIMLLVISTGGLTSTLFFLLYFLAFGLTFAFEPATVFVFVILATLFFIQSALTDDTVGNFLHIGSLFLVSPFAFIFGYETRKDEKKEKKAKQRKTHKRKRK